MEAGCRILANAILLHSGLDAHVSIYYHPRVPEFRMESTNTPPLLTEVYFSLLMKGRLLLSVSVKYSSDFVCLLISL